jgi:hypothetical protein
MRHDDVTFGLAALGFVLLATDAARRWRGRRSRSLTLVTAAVITAHVLCVWAFRFDWSLAAMWQKSAVAFVIFHVALAGVLAATVAHEPWRNRLVTAAFVIVCTGALPAPFRYPEIAWLRWPLLLVAAGAGGYAFAPRRTRATNARDERRRR